MVIRRCIVSYIHCKFILLLIIIDDASWQKWDQEEAVKSDNLSPKSDHLPQTEM